MRKLPGFSSHQGRHHGEGRFLAVDKIKHALSGVAAKRAVAKLMVAVTIFSQMIAVVPSTQAAEQVGLVVKPMLSTGGAHTLFLKTDGTVWGSGLNSSGQLGNGANTNVSTAVQVSSLNGVVAVAGGQYHSLALKANGTVWAWGANSSGQLGNGSNTGSNVPVQVSGLTGVIAVAAGGSHSLALKANGTVWAWGLNGQGQLGDGTNTDSNVPVQVFGLSSVATVASGLYFSLAIKTDGTSWGWGQDNRGQLCDGTNTDSNVPVQATGITTAKSIAGGAEHAIIALDDGTVRSCGRNNEGQLGDGTNTDSNVPVTVSGLSGVASVVGGLYHSAALKADGTVRTWGWNLLGQLGDGTNTDSNVPVTPTGLTGASQLATSSTSEHVMALKADGTIWGWANNGAGEFGNGNTTVTNYPVQSLFDMYVGPAGIVEVAGGADHAIALKVNGDVWGWGYNGDGEIGNGTNTNSLTPLQTSVLTAARSIASGGSHNLAIDSDGTVWAWGANNYGQLADGNTPFSSNVPVQVSGLTDAVAVAGGYYHSLALKANGTVWAWGANNYGQLGDGTNTDSDVPVQVSGLTDVVAIASGLQNSMALLADGSVWMWGFGNGGQLGNGTNAHSNVPVQVSTISGVRAIADGDVGAMALLGDGTVWAWGVNAFGSLGDGTNTDSNTPVAVSNVDLASDVVTLAAGGGHMVAIKANGTVWAWGLNASGELGDGTNTDRNVPVQTTGIIGGKVVGRGFSSTYVVKSNGTLWAWGYNGDGELGNGTLINSSSPVQVQFPAPPGPTGNTTDNSALFSRLGVNANATVTIAFTLADTLSSQLTVTFDPAFTGMNVSGASANTPNTPGCMSNFVATGPNSFTADKAGCSGVVMISGIQVVNPPTPGSYQISWTNDDPGYTLVAIVDSDQVTVNAQVAPSITFDLNAGTTNASVSAPYSVALGSLTTVAVAHSDNSTVNSIWANLDTNAAGGAIVTVLSANAALASLSVPGDTVPNAAVTMSAGTANYGICVNSVSPPSAGSGTFQPSTPYDTGTCDPTGSSNAVKALSTVTPTQILDTAAGPVTTGSAEILVNATSSTATVAHSDYADVLTFVASGTF